MQIRADDAHAPQAGLESIFGRTGPEEGSADGRAEAFEASLAEAIRPSARPGDAEAAEDLEPPLEGGGGDGEASLESPPFPPEPVPSGQAN